MKSIQLLTAVVIIALSVQQSFSQSWSLTGNAAITNSNFLGTTDNKKLKLRTNNKDRIIITGGGLVGIGNNAPVQDLQLTGTMQIDRNSTGGSTTPAMILNGISTNIVTVLKVDGIQKSSYGYDQSTDDFVIATDDVGLRPDFIINRDLGYIGLNTKTPAERLHVMGNEILDGDLTMASSLGKGDINFTSEQQSISFPTVGTLTPAPMIYMWGAPSGYKRMVLAHSPAFSDWGLQYDDGTGNFYFLADGIKRMAIDLQYGNVGIGDVQFPDDRFEVHGGNSSFYGNIGVQTPATNSRTIQCGLTQGAVIGIGTVEYIQDWSSSTLATANDWIPATDNLYSLGTSANRWQDLWAVDGTINTSDATMKTNVRDLNYGLNEIMQLRPVSYQWKNDQSYTKLGMIAQEIQTVLPEVVRDWDYMIDEQTGAKTRVASDKLEVMYDDIIPVLIKGMQEQQQRIEYLESLVNGLLGEPGTMIIKSALDSNSQEQPSDEKSEGGYLEQNIPNPAHQTTTVRYMIPAGVDAEIVVTGPSGKVVQQFMNLVAGNSQVEISTSQLASGIYQYTLYLMGKKADSKQMIISK